MKRVFVAVLAAIVASATPCQARVYGGQPDLALTAAVVRAGGGPADFQTMRFLRAVAGPALPGELKVLTKRHGAAAVADFPATFAFLIDDAVRAASSAGVAFPAPKPVGDRRALVAALWRAGRADGGGWDVGVMLERLVTHPIHHRIMRDANASPRIGAAKNASAHVLLGEMMHDLAVADGIAT